MRRRRDYRSEIGDRDRRSTRLDGGGGGGGGKERGMELGIME